LRTLAGVSGADRIRTPVASKKAFAIAAPTLVDGRSPDPPTKRPSATLPLGFEVPFDCTVPVLVAGRVAKPRISRHKRS
jgi:hypothetical protein